MVVSFFGYTMESTRITVGNLQHNNIVQKSHRKYFRLSPVKCSQDICAKQTYSGFKRQYYYVTMTTTQLRNFHCSCYANQGKTALKNFYTYI
jgi:hypothetical protein